MNLTMTFLLNYLAQPVMIYLGNPVLFAQEWLQRYQIC